MENHGGFALYFWHGMRPGAWLSLLRRNRFRVSPACALQTITVSLISPMHALLHYVSEAVYRKRLKAFEMKQPPIFIIGCWRTGTTYLHDLFACDPELGYPTTYECMIPSHFLLTERLARFWFKFLLPKTRPPDNVSTGFDRPQEDEFALCNMGQHSPLLTMAMPRRGPVDMDYLDLRDVTDKERKAWTDALKWFVRRVAFHQGKRLVLKSPTHTARLPLLLKLFPGARFVYISRHPLSVYPSNVHLWRSMNSTQGLQNPARDEGWLQEFVLGTFMRMFERYEEDRKLVPPGHLVEISYEELVARPKAVMSDIYSRLELGDFARAEPAVDEYLSGTKDYKTNSYELAQGMKSVVMSRWASYARRFGYDREDAERAEAA